jgi:hypothetical protein
MTALANALHLALAQLQCHAWWEYVPSQADGADFPSRPHSAESSEFYDKEGFQVWSSPLRLPSFDNLRYPHLEDVDNWHDGGGSGTRGYCCFGTVPSTVPRFFSSC